MRFASMLWLCALGCGFSGSPQKPSDATDAPDGCLGTGNWVVCPPEPLTTSLALGDINTGSDPHCKSDPTGWGMHQNDACIIMAMSITITANVIGPKPLVLVASGDITVNTLDVSSQITAGKRGPYAVDPACNAGNGGIDSAAGAGGGGGGFGTAGALGGDANNVVATRGASGALAQAPVDKLRGGCPGGTGGDGGAVGTGGARGEGGGAVFLLAGGTLTITGTINASGAGGAGATNPRGGGGGGGSGGMIAILASSITAHPGSKVFANGGGGGGGADNGNVGMPGKDPTTPMTVAGGGTGGGAAGKAGGAGGFLTTLPIQGFDSTGTGGGGGGGGGGVGVIRVLGPQSLGPALVSPAPS